MVKKQAEQFLTDEEIKEFQLLMRAEKNISFTKAEALDQGSRLAMLFELLQKFEHVQLSGIDIVEKAKEGVKK